MKKDNIDISIASQKSFEFSWQVLSRIDDLRVDNIVFISEAASFRHSNIAYLKQDEFFMNLSHGFFKILTEDNNYSFDFKKFALKIAIDDFKKNASVLNWPSKYVSLKFICAKSFKWIEKKSREILSNTENFEHLMIGFDNNPLKDNDFFDLTEKPKSIISSKDNIKIKQREKVKDPTIIEATATLLYNKIKNKEP